MKFRVLLVLAMFLAATPVLAQKVYIDYDTGYDFDTIKTFAWSKTEETSLAKSNIFMHSRIVNAIEHYLSGGALREAAEGEEPSIYVTYHASSKEKLTVNTTSYGYGYPGGWRGYGYGGYYGGGYYGSGMASSTTSVSSYDVGTLVVDAWDTKTKKLVWRGTATNIIVSPNRDKMMKKIDKGLKKIVKQWKKIREAAARD